MNNLIGSKPLSINKIFDSPWNIWRHPSANKYFSNIQRYLLE